MAFFATQTPRYEWPITVRVPAETGGLESYDFFLTFKRLSKTEIVQLQKDVRGKDEMESLDVLVPLVLGWREVKGPDGNDLEFSSKAFEQLLEDCPTIGGPIADALFESLYPAKEKN